MIILLQEAMFFSYEKAIVFIENEYCLVKNSFPFSVSVHEFGHTVNYSLGLSNNKKDWLSNDLPNDTALDAYAEIYPDEFAIGFEAFCYDKEERDNFFLKQEKPEIFILRPETLEYFLQYSHNKEELFARSRMSYEYFEKLFSEWK